MHKNCPNCKKELPISAIECPYCGVILSKYNKVRPIKSFYSASYKDVYVLEELKNKLKDYKQLSLTERTELVSLAKKHALLDIVAQDLSQQELDPLDKKIILKLSSLSLQQRKLGISRLPKAFIFFIASIVAIGLAYLLLK